MIVPKLNIKLNIKNIFRNLFSDRYHVILIISLVAIVCVSVLINNHTIGYDSDGIGYVSAYHFLNGQPLENLPANPNFILHRILTTFLSIETIGIISDFVGSFNIGWLIWDIIIFMFLNIIFFKLLLKMFENSLTALLGGLFLASNYAMVTAGLGYFVDIGGWLFYVLALYFLYEYIETQNNKNIWLVAVSLAVGGFFKESALFAYIPFFSVLFYENYRSAKMLFKKIVWPTAVIFLPLAVHHYIMYLRFNHVYWYWVRLNQTTYIYGSRLVEYIKSFGSLLHLLIPISLAGFIIYVKSIFRDKLFSDKQATKQIIFIISVMVSSLPAIMWPGITQRVLFSIVPGLVMLACFLIQKYRNYWPWFALTLVIYATISFLTDPVLLDLINLPI